MHMFKAIVEFVLKLVGAFAIGMFTLVGIPIMVMLCIPDPELSDRFFEAYLPTWAFVAAGSGVVGCVQRLRSDRALTSEEKARDESEVREEQRETKWTVFSPEAGHRSSLPQEARFILWASIVALTVVMVALLPLLLDSYRRLFG